MKRTIVILAALAVGRGEIIDRVAAVVGQDVIARSEVQQEARLEAFFKGEPPPPPLDPQSPEYGQILERLIEQKLVRQEMEQMTLPGATDEQVTKWLEEMRPRSADPARYGLREQDLVDYARRQLDLEQFINVRFKPGLQIPPEKIEEHYSKVFVPELKRRGIKQIPPLEEVRGQIEEILIEERVNNLLEEWLKDLRSRVRVKILEPENS